MSAFLETGFKRRLAQVLVALLFVFISLPSILLLVLLSIHRISPLHGWLGEFAGTFMLGLSFPLDDPTSQFSTVIVATLPAIVAVVCFEVDTGPDNTKAASSRLNGLGKVTIIALIVGAICSLLLLIVFNVAFGFVDELINSADITKAVQLLMTGILSFQFLYIIKLLGVENAVAGTGS